MHMAEEQKRQDGKDEQRCTRSVGCGCQLCRNADAAVSQLKSPEVWAAEQAAQQAEKEARAREKQKFHEHVAAHRKAGGVGAGFPADEDRL